MRERDREREIEREREREREQKNRIKMNKTRFNYFMIDSMHPGSNISSTECDVNILIGKEWTVINRLSIIRKSDVFNKRKGQFFQVIAVSVLLYGSISWNQMKRLEINIDENSIRMMCIVWRNYLNSSCTATCSPSHKTSK